MNPSPDLRHPDGSRARVAAGVAALAAAATAAWVASRARRAEREHPPTGRTLDVDGVKLHCIDRGEGPTVVLIHGNMVSALDFEASGVIDALARTHRVIAFDRPGFGHSTRPRDRLWTPHAQAKTLAAALERLGVDRATVVGHSMGTLVALAMALDDPQRVGGLVLLGGYYFPTLRADAVLTAPVALPVIGDVLRYTVTAATARLLLERSVKAMFAPRAVPPGFFAWQSREMMVRPSQLRANAEDAAVMIPAARAISARYGELRVPVTIVAGRDDAVVDVDAHAVRLHDALPGSVLSVVPDTGHMVHYAMPPEAVAAIGAGAALAPSIAEASSPLPGGAARDAVAGRMP